MKTILLLTILAVIPVLAQRAGDKDRGGGSPISIEAKRIENRIKRDLRGKLTLYAERMNPEFLHPSVSPIFNDMIARGLVQAIDDSQFKTDGPCYEDEGKTIRAPASAPERRIGGIICMDPQFIAELDKGDMKHLIELAYHEHGHNFGYGEDDSNNLAAEVGDTFSEETLSHMRFIPTESTELPSFIRQLKDGFMCLTSSDFNIMLAFDDEKGWFSAISQDGHTVALRTAYASKGQIGNTLSAHITIPEITIQSSRVSWSFDTRYGTKPPIYLILKDAKTKERYVKKIEKPYDVNLLFVAKPGECPTL